MSHFIHASAQNGIFLITMGNLHNLRCGNEQHYFAIYSVSFYSSLLCLIVRWIYLYLCCMLGLIQFTALIWYKRVDENDSFNELSWLLKLILWLDFRFIRHCSAYFTVQSAFLGFIPVLFSSPRIYIIFVKWFLFSGWWHSRSFSKIN